MANVQLKNGYFNIANDLYEQLYARDFSLRQIRILLIVLRMSYGCNSKSAFIRPQNRFELAYLYKGAILKELRVLENANVLFCDYDNKIFAINKNYDEWKIPFHRLYDFEKNQNLIFQNVSEKQTKELLNKELFNPEKVTKKVTFESTGSQISNKKVTKKVTKRLPNKELLQAENADTASNTSTPKDIKYIKDINSINNIYICNKENSNSKKTDPYINPYLKKFKEEYKKEFNNLCYLNNAQSTKLIEIASEVPDFLNLIPVLVKKFSKISFSFNGKTQKPGLRWLLEQGNWSGVLSGEFDEQTEQTEHKTPDWAYSLDGLLNQYKKGEANE